jgi:hypothetical protein
MARTKGGSFTLTEKWEWRGALNGDDQRRPTPVLKQPRLREAHFWTESFNAENFEVKSFDGEIAGLTSVEMRAKTWNSSTSLSESARIARVNVH